MQTFGGARPAQIEREQSGSTHAVRATRLSGLDGECEVGRRTPCLVHPWRIP